MNKRIIIIIIGITFFVCIAVTTYIFVDKNNMYHVDINNPNLIKTENGYKEELIIEETTITNKYIKEAKRRKNAPDIKKTYNIQYYNEELKENVSIDVGKNQYDELNIGDNVKVTRVVNYNKNGLRLNYEDSVEKIE